MLEMTYFFGTSSRTQPHVIQSVSERSPILAQCHAQEMSRDDRYDALLVAEALSVAISWNVSALDVSLKATGQKMHCFLNVNRL